MISLGLGGKVFFFFSGARRRVSSPLVVLPQQILSTTVMERPLPSAFFPLRTTSSIPRFGEHTQKEMHLFIGVVVFPPPPPPPFLSGEVRHTSPPVLPPSRNNGFETFLDSRKQITLLFLFFPSVSEGIIQSNFFSFLFHSLSGRLRINPEPFFFGKFLGFFFLFSYSVEGKAFSSSSSFSQFLFL